LTGSTLNHTPRNGEIAKIKHHLIGREIRISVENQNIRFGCAGWSYKDWLGPLYDPEQSMLQQYASIFDTVELNSSFYRAPEEGTILGLTKYTKRGFMFSAKMNQKFTHDMRLRVAEETQDELEQFVQLFDPLLTQDRLGCLLIQLPPSLKKNEKLLESFLAALPHRYEYVVEFRHPSWINNSTWTILAKYEAAYCIVDEPLLPPELHVTSPIGYIRWHGHGDHPWYNYRYTNQQLEEWVPRVKEIAKNTKKTFGIFNNHFHGYAPENCLQMMQTLGIARPNHEKALRRVHSYIERELAGLPPSGTLDQFTHSQNVK
jgi:uncharacterized protein YecE (DUF72 family)